QDYRPISVSVNVAGLGKMWSGGSLLRPGLSPQKAPIIHFNGPLAMKLEMDSGALSIPCDYDHDAGPARDAWYDKHPPTYDVETLKRGQQSRLTAVIGTQGLGRGTFAVLANDAVPKDAVSKASVRFTRSDKSAI